MVLLDKASLSTVSHVCTRSSTFESMAAAWTFTGHKVRRCTGRDKEWGAGGLLCAGARTRPVCKDFIWYRQPTDVCQGVPVEAPLRSAVGQMLSSSLLLACMHAATPPCVCHGFTYAA